MNNFSTPCLNGSSRLLLVAVASVLFGTGLASAAPTLNWSTTVDSGASAADRTRAVGMASNGDVIAASQIGSGTDAQIRVQRLANADGTVSWTRDVGTAGFAEDVADIVVDPTTGDSYVAARAATASNGLDWSILKVNGSDGTLAWSISHSTSGNDVPRAITLASDGNVIVAGMETVSSSGRARVAKLDSGSGVQIWSFTEPAASDAFDVITDSGGNVYFCGSSGNSTLIKALTSAGAVSWNKGSGGFSPSALTSITLFANGDIGVAGFIGASMQDTNFRAERIPASGAAAVWSYSVDGGANGADVAYDIVADSAGNAYVAGMVTGVGGQTGTLRKLSPTGTEVWTRSMNGTLAAQATDSFFAVRLVDSGVVAAGTQSNTATLADMIISRYDVAGTLLDDTVYNGVANNNDTSLSRNLFVASGTTAVVAGDSENATPSPDGIVRSYSLSAPALAPEIAVSGNSTNIENGDTIPSLLDHTDFGSQLVFGGTEVRTFTVSNSGTGELTLYGTPKVMVSGTNAADFSVTDQPDSPVAATNGFTTFQVTFDPSSIGLRTATISIANDDSDENPFTFDIQGTGFVPPPTVISLNPSSGISTGGTIVTITGTNFTGATVVTFGGTNASSFTVDSAAQITATTPAHAAGAVSVLVTTPGGTNAANTFFTYTTPEIVVHNGSHSLAVELSDGQVTPVNFGSTAPNSPSLRNFLVRNIGDADLTITSITVPAGYMTNGAPVVVAPASSFGFQVSLSTATPATYTGSIVISSDDMNESSFDFPVTGTVVAPGSDPVVSVGGDVAVQGTTGSPVLGGPPGATLYSLIGSPAINSSGVLASAVQIRHTDASLHTGMMVGQPMVLIATDTQTAPSFAGVNHYNFGPPVINEAGHIAFTGEVRGVGITTNVNSRCLFSNASDGTLKLVAQVGMATTLGSNLKTIGNFSIGGDLVIFLSTLADNRVVLFGWDANTGLRALMRNGQSLDANGVTKTVQSFTILEANNASSGHGKEISVAPTGESLVTLGVTFTDGSSGVVVGSFDGTSDTGFGATYGASQQLSDSYAAPGVIPLARWNTFRSPGFDNTGNYYGFISQMVTNTLAGVTSTNNVGVFVDTAPGVLTLQLRENDTATGTSGLVFSDFSDLVLGGGDYEFLVKGEVRGSGVVINVNDKGLWAQHATNGLVLVAREGSEAPGVAGSTFFRLTQLALPGTAQPMFQASMKTGVGGVTAANDTGLWVINEAGEVKLAVREGDVLDVAGTNRTVTAITALLNGTTTGGALGRRVFLADGQLTLLLTFSGGVQANARVVVP